MPPLLQSFLAALLRHALTGAAVYFVSHGYFTASQADDYVAALVCFVLGYGWSLYQKIRTRGAWQCATAYYDEP